MNFTNDNGKVVGELKDEIYRSRRKSSVHLLRVMDAWGVDAKIVKELKGKCKEVRIGDQEDMIIYSIPFDTFLEKAVERDFGHGAQLFLPRKYWTSKEAV